MQVAACNRQYHDNTISLLMAIAADKMLKLL
jgi:hypothetical protein